MKKIYVLLSLFFVLFSCTEMKDDQGNTPVVGRWELASYEVAVEPQSMYDEVMSLFYPGGLPAVPENTGIIFSGKYYRFFDALGETASLVYKINEDTLTFTNTPAGTTGIGREVIFRRTNNELRLGNSIFEKGMPALYKEWIYLGSINWWENEDSAERYSELAPLMEDHEAIIDLFERGLEQLDFYAVYNKQ